MVENNSGTGVRRIDPGKRGKCRLLISNRSGSILNLVIQGAEVKVVRAMSIRRRKRLRLVKGTYVVEAWLSTGRIRIIPVDIPHIRIEKITTRKDVSIRGRKIVADLINNRARLEVDRERNSADLD
ncbi:MAG: hypothetical protein P1P86_13550 [Bacteroidales bacterium]|nr:hypothetical protein [Bacteroidales bacterium]